MVGECSTNFSSFLDFGKPIPYLKRANWKLVLSTISSIVLLHVHATCEESYVDSFRHVVPILRVMIAKRGVYSSYLKVYEAVVWHLSEISGAVAVKSFESAGS